MAGNLVLYERVGHVGKIILNRPETINALSRALLEELDQALDMLAEDNKAYVGVISGNGVKGFSAGFDFMDSAQVAPGLEARRKDTRHEQELFLKIHYHIKPIIAAIHGHCIGGGTEIAISCDMVVAADNLSFGNSEVTWGLDFAPHLPLEPYKMPQNICKEYYLTGKMITAEEGYRIGLFNHVVPYEKLEEEAMRLANEVCQLSPFSLQVTKQMLNKTYDLQGFPHILDHTTDLYSMFRLCGGTELSETFYRMVREDGFKKALAFMKARRDEDV